MVVSNKHFSIILILFHCFMWVFKKYILFIDTRAQCSVKVGFKLGQQGIPEFKSLVL